eukprot:98771_1
MSEHMDHVINAFFNCQDPIRKMLIELLEKKFKTSTESMYTMYNKLKNVEYHPEGITDIRQIALFINQLWVDGHQDVLNEIADIGCYIPLRSLFEEIKGNNLDGVQQIQKQIDAIDLILDNNDTSNDDLTLILTVLKNKQQTLRRALLLEIEKRAKIAAHTNREFVELKKKIQTVKQHKKYLYMKKKALELSDLEISAVLFYCDSDKYCYFMRKSHRTNGSCKWKNLFRYLCSAIDKLHQVFHYQSKKFKKKLQKVQKLNLFYGTTISDISNKQKQELTLDTITSFSSSLSVAKEFAAKIRYHPNDFQGMIMVLEGAGSALYNGSLKGADISWMSKYSGENEFLILPTKFRNFSSVDVHQRKTNLWLIRDDHRMYITSDYHSKQRKYIIDDHLDVRTEQQTTRLRKCKKINIENDCSPLNHSEEKMVILPKSSTQFGSDAVKLKNLIVGKENKDPSTDVSESDESDNYESKYKESKLTPYKIRSSFYKCNGDCGSRFAKLIENLIHPKNKGVSMNEEEIISDMFWLYGSNMRTELIKLLENERLCNNGINDDLEWKKMLNHLKDENCVILGKEWIDKMMRFFTILKDNCCIHILQNLCDKTCLIPDTSLSDVINTQTKQIFGKSKYQNKIEFIKSTDKYNEMRKRGMELNNQELLSIMLYCDQDAYCYGMRKSHRDKRSNSCKWRKLTYYLCSAIDKLRQIFHLKNRKFRRRYVKGRQAWNDKLYHGIHGIGKVDSHYSLHTVSSFSTDCSVSVSFAFNGGMIIAIPNAFKSIYEGDLMAADVSWISNFGHEGEFIVAPCTFNQIIKIDHNNPNYQHIVMNTNKVSIYEVCDFQSQQSACIEKQLWRRRICTATMQDYNLLLQNSTICDKYTTNCTPSLMITSFILFNGLQTFKCSKCHVVFKRCEFIEGLLNGTLECPACRLLLITYPLSNKRELCINQLECYNVKCKKKIIKYSDLETVDVDRQFGYKCRFCNTQQRKALLERYSDKHMNDLNLVSNELMDHIENAVSIDNVDMKIKRDDNTKREFIELLKYLMNTNERNGYDQIKILDRYPIVDQWIKFFNKARM